MSEYQPGDIANGHVWTGTEWMPIRTPEQQAKPRLLTWEQWIMLICVGAVMLLAVLLSVLLFGGFDFIQDWMR